MKTIRTLIATAVLCQFCGRHPVMAGTLMLMGMGGAGADATVLTPGYVSGRWYNSLLDAAPTSTSSAQVAGRLICYPFIVSPPGFRAQAMAMAVTTADTTPNFVALAIYSNASGVPGTLVDSISTNITTATAATVSEPMANGSDALAAGAYWTCAATNSTTIRWSTMGSTAGNGTIGGATAAAAMQLVTMALVCTGGTTNCGPAWASGAGSSYTWPSSLVGATWSDTGNTTAPTIALEAQ